MSKFLYHFEKISRIFRLFAFKKIIFMNNKNIWIINEYAGSPYHGMEFRHYYLSQSLKNLGYHVTIITASYSHLFKKLPEVHQKLTLQNIDGIDYLWIKVPRYTASHSKKRVWKWIVFTLSLFRLPIHQLSKPDFIILSPMQTMPIMPALYWKKKFKSKLIFEVKDIWPLSIIELGGYSPSHPFIKLLKYFEKISIQKSDAIVSVLPNYGEYLKEQWFSKKIYYIPNGIDLNEMNKTEALSDEIEKQIPSDKFIVGYAGTLGIANAMNYLIDAAKLLSNEKNILFVIVGDGSEKNNLIKQAEKLNNVLFLPSLPKRQIQNLLQKFDVCYIGLQNTPLFRYGVSPNKIFDYMYAAKPIVFAVPSPNNTVEQAQCGIVIKNTSDASEIAKAIMNLYLLPKEKLAEMGNNGKNFVLQHHTFTTLAKQYEQIFNTFS